MLTPGQIPAEIVSVCRRLQQAGHQALLVGGAVRDHLRLSAGQESAKDFDIATSAPPQEVIRLFGPKNTVPTGLQHGTVTVLVTRGPGRQAGPGEREPVEVTTFRGEGAYSDGRRPDQVVYIDDLTEDLRRRDFTINAIAYDPIADQIFDPFAGQADLSARLIRAVGDAAARFSEDGLRTMRAVRFAAHLGFHIDQATYAAIPAALPTFRRVSGERVRDELLKLLKAPAAGHGLALMQGSGLLAEILPELHQALLPAGPAAFTKRFAGVGLTPPDAILRLGALLFPLRPVLRAAPLDTAEAMLDRLKLSAKERDRLLALLRSSEIPQQDPWPAAQVRRYLAATPAALRADLAAVLRAELAAEGHDAEQVSAGPLHTLRQAAEEEARGPALSIKQLALSGNEVMTLLGLAKGPAVGVVLRLALERVLDDPSLNTKERLTALLPGLYQEVQGQGQGADVPARP